jgi:hypothetical protein
MDPDAFPPAPPTLICSVSPRSHRQPALPASAEAVYLYLSALVTDANAADYSASTLERRLAAITYVHEVNGHGASPARHVKVRELMAGIRRTYAKAEARRDPLTTAQMAAMVAGLDSDTLALTTVATTTRARVVGRAFPLVARSTAAPSACDPYVER